MPDTSPARAWHELKQGNQRFISGKPRHPRQNVERRGELVGRQEPYAAFFGCSDSRLAAEIIFDLGLGDIFVVRNAGQIISDSVLGSLEYAVEVLGVRLIVVLGHDECGAVRAAIDCLEPDARDLPPHIRNLIEPILPAVNRVKSNGDGRPDATEVGREHLRDTVADLVRGSELLSDAIAAGTLAIVGANYRLLEGMAVPDVVIGDIGEPAADHR
ncbi:MULTISPECIES: carbonic anhydrase [unclassified Cryobacterium]|uniref:carbonic anhydrase n=1 Tax=unclassified Cryobacterium TaxID=2649013 RepID=UPI00144704DB|nr:MULTISPECIES: carbonic anhydrase [unclassified Cryobacterium]